MEMDAFIQSKAFLQISEWEEAVPDFVKCSLQEKVEGLFVRG